MINKKLGFGVVGAGVISSFHIRALQRMDDVEVVSVCDIKEDKVKKIADEFNLNWTTDYDAMLRDPRIDVVNVTVPSGLHATLGIKAAAARKHVIIEKPIDINLQKADALIDTCKKNNVTLAVISQMRYYDSVLKLYDIVTSGKLGKIIQGDAYIKWYRSEEYYRSGEWRGTRKLDGGGAFMNQGVHYVDLLLSVMGPVEAVTAKVKTAARDIEVEDLGIAMLEFKSGALGVIEATTAAYPGLPARVDILGTKGTIIFEGEDIKFVHVEGEQEFRKNESKKDGASDPLDIEVTPYIREFTDVIAAIREKRKPKVSGEEARRALELILAIYKSSEQKKTIKLPLK